jgi:hypothetical protein
VPAWEVVRTSALSRRWRHFWASVPCLDIHYPCGCRDNDDDDDEDEDEDEDEDKDKDEDEDEAAAAAAGGGQDWYAEFVKHLLLKRRSSAPVDTLWLRWNHDDANTWIAHAVRRKATHIELSGKRHHPVLDPEYWIFLYGNLKILQLSHLRMNNDDLSQLCSRCTSLEELELQNVDIDATHIRSTSLKRLSMVRCFNRDGLSVDTPNLVLLRCIRPHSFIPGIENSGSLLTATILHDDCCLLHGRPPCSNCADAKKPRHSESQSPSDGNRSTTGLMLRALGTMNLNLNLMMISLRILTLGTLGTMNPKLNLMMIALLILMLRTLGTMNLKLNLMMIALLILMLRSLGTMNLKLNLMMIALLILMLRSLGTMNLKLNLMMIALWDLMLSTRTTLMMMVRLQM